MIIDLTEAEIELLGEMFDALQDGFEYFTEENGDVFSSLQEKVGSCNAE